MRGFTEDPKEEISRNQRFRVREASHPCYYASRGRDSSYLDLFFTFWADKWEFRVPAQCYLIRPSEGVVHPSEPGSKFCEALVRLGERFFA